jgi:hypothetical protein
MTTGNFCFYLQNRLIQPSQTGGQRYSDTSPFSIPCKNISKNDVVHSIYLSLYLYIYLSIYLSINAPRHLCVYPHISMPVCHSVHLPKCLCPFMYNFFSASACMSHSPSIQLQIDMSYHLPNCLSVHLYNVCVTICFFCSYFLFYINLSII